MTEITVGELIEYCNPVVKPAEKPKAKSLVYFQGRVGRGVITDEDTTAGIFETLQFMESRLFTTSLASVVEYRKRFAAALRLCLEIHKL